MSGFPIKWLLLAFFLAAIVLLSVFSLFQKQSSAAGTAQLPSQDSSLSDRDWEYVSVLALDVESQAKRIEVLLDVIQSINASMTELKLSSQPLADANPVANIEKRERLHTTGVKNAQNQTTNRWDDIVELDDQSQPSNLSSHSNQSQNESRQGQLMMLGKQSDIQSVMGIIPSGSMALETFLLTAMIGRVPDQSTPAKPLPFKVMINGSVQLGYETIDTTFFGAVAMGFATGDFLLSCAIANVFEVSIVQDGKYYFASSDSGGPIGYLTTANGNTCLPGKLITTVPQVIGGSALLAGVAGWAQSNSQSSLNDLPNNSTINLNTPSAIDFAGNQALQSVLTDAGSWWYDKLQNQWDAVIVPSGEKTILHFSKNLVLKPLLHSE